MKNSSQRTQQQLLIGSSSEINRQLPCDPHTLATLVAHELREPIQAIRSFLAVVLDGRTGQLTERQEDFLLSANHTARRLSRLVDDLQLVLSDGQMTNYQKRLVDLNTSILRCCRELSEIAKEHNVSLTWTPDNNSKCNVYGDPDRMDQILLNVLENAIQYSPHGASVNIAINSVSGRYWQVTIENEADLHQALAPEDWLKPFGRGGRVGGQGLGLGLTVVQTLVQAHHGRFGISVNSSKVQTVIEFPQYSNDAD